MGIEGLVCRSCNKLVAPTAEHWVSECPDPSINPGIVATVMERQKERKPTLEYLTVTQVLGKVRDEAIKMLDLPYYPEAQGFCDMELGTYVDSMATRGWELCGWQTQVRLEGEFWGIPFHGRLDAAIVADGVRHIRDCKFTSEGQLYNRKKDGLLAGVEASAQVSMYGRMGIINDGRLETDTERWEQFTADWDAATGTEGYIDLGAKVAAVNWKTKAFNEAWITQRTEEMTLERIGGVRPGGSKTTVEENARILWEVAQRRKLGESRKEIMKDVPMSCEPMYGGACRAYCGSNRVCLRAAGISLASKMIIGVDLPDWPND